MHTDSYSDHHIDRKVDTHLPRMYITVQTAPLSFGGPLEVLFGYRGVNGHPMTPNWFISLIGFSKIDTAIHVRFGLVAPIPAIWGDFEDPCWK